MGKITAAIDVVSQNAAVGIAATAFDKSERNISVNAETIQPIALGKLEIRAKFAEVTAPFAATSKSHVQNTTAAEITAPHCANTVIALIMPALLPRSLFGTSFSTFAFVFSYILTSHFMIIDENTFVIPDDYGSRPTETFAFRYKKTALFVAEPLFGEFRDYTNSIIAISAPSPRRKPFLSTRV